MTIRKKVICPACGGTGIPIVYGLPDMTLEKAAGRGEVAVGGCIVSDDNPDHQCPDCGYEWLANRSVTT